MAQKRIELRITPINHDEKALVDALDALGDEYGAKGRFLKARLLRGYVAIMREVESIKQESDPLAALDRLAQSVNSGHYRVLRALLYERTAPVATTLAAQPAVASSPAALASSADSAPRPPRAEVLVAESVPEHMTIPSDVAAADSLVGASVEAVASQDQDSGDALPDGGGDAADAAATPPNAQEGAAAPDAAQAEEGGASTDPDASQPVPTPPVAHNWSRFAGMAGKRGA